MKTLTSVIGAAIATLAFGASAYASSPDIYIVNFRDAGDAKSQQLDAQLPSAVATAGVNAEEVVIDTSTAAKWMKGAHEAFDRDIVPVFNKWVGLPGFAAIVDANSKQVIGCVNSSLPASQMAENIRQLSAKASGKAALTRASNDASTRCPAAHNIDTP